MTLYANQAKIGEGRVDQIVLFALPRMRTLDIGRDNGLPVGPAYSQKSPYPFTGTVEKVRTATPVLHHAAVAAGISA